MDKSVVDGVNRGLRWPYGVGCEGGHADGRSDSGLVHIPGARACSGSIAGDKEQTGAGQGSLRE